MTLIRFASALLAVIQLGALNATAQAWDETGHIIVTRLASEKLPDDMPDWLRTPEVSYRLEYLSSEPDRWRGQKNVHLDHCNNPNHYIDEEYLYPFGLSLKNLPPLRRELLDIMAAQRALEPDKFPRYDRSRDRSYTNLVPGLLPYEIAELQWKLAGSWTTLKTYEQHRELVSSEMIDNARQNIIYQMGILSHFVGDGCQPLHLTKHHHGWVGDNPRRYTTDKGFHAYIDGGVISHHKLTPDGMEHLAKPARRVTKTKYWRDICAYLHESFLLVEPLYALEKSGELKGPKGKAFIEDRLVEGGAMLSGIWATAYRSAVIDDFRVRQLTGKAGKNSQAEKSGEGATKQSRS